MLKQFCCSFDNFNFQKGNDCKCHHLANRLCFIQAYMQQKLKMQLKMKQILNRLQTCIKFLMVVYVSDTILANNAGSTTT